MIMAFLNSSVLQMWQTELKVAIHKHLLKVAKYICDILVLQDMLTRKT